MGSISIKKQCDELDTYTQITDYISRVLDNFSNMDKVDANDLYEIVYAKKLCESKLSHGIKNDMTRKAYEDTLTRITLITDLLNDDIVSKIMKNPLDRQKAKKVNESRHSKLNKAPKVDDKMRPITRTSSQHYILKILPKLAIITMFYIFILSGVDIGKVVSSILLGSSTHQEAAKAATDLSGTLGLIINILAMLTVGFSAISLSLDLIYIAFPFTRGIMGPGRPNTYGDLNKKSVLISEAAIEAVKYDGSIVGYRYSDDCNKVKYSRDLLNTILDKLTNKKWSSIRGDKTLESHIGYLTMLRNKVKSSKKDIDRINYLADAEIYYLNNKEYFNKFLGEETV